MAGIIVEEVVNVLEPEIEVLLPKLEPFLASVVTKLASHASSFGPITKQLWNDLVAKLTALKNEENKIESVLQANHIDILRDIIQIIFNEPVLTKK